MLVLFVASALNIPAQGQVNYRGGVAFIRGEAVSPQLTGMDLEVLFDGIADLYCRVDDRVLYYYITDRDGRLFTLSVPPEGKAGNKDALESWQEGFISVLKVVMKDAPSLAGRIESIIPGKTEMTRLMEEYHALVALSDEIIIYKAPPPAFLPHFGIFGDWNADFIKTMNPGELEGYNIDPSLYPTAGISLLATMPRISDKLSLIVNLGAGRRYFYGYYISEDVPLPMTELHHELHLHNLLVSGDLLIRYDLGTGNIKPYVSGGFSGRTVVADKSRIETDVCYDSMVISDTYEYVTEEKTSFGLTISLGLSVGISGRVSITTAISYSEFLITGMPGNYRSAGLNIGANFQ
ncbi:MAG: hypothetical protein MUE37_14525 [Bacteroidales bacterium]|jgi:hypothetical protein|nr:hypothetical protein [Bacteroidales bacterium]